LNQYNLKRNINNEDPAIAKKAFDREEMNLMVMTQIWLRSKEFDSVPGQSVRGHPTSGFY
jgi:hypothetical protein